MIRVGTCSWTEKTLIQSGEFYPSVVDKHPRPAVGRLRFYAENFDTVEVDSTYYAPPSEASARLWAERTPPGFVFHVKVYGPLTGHAASVKSLPKDMRSDALDNAHGFAGGENPRPGHIYVRDPLLLRELSRRFVNALRPLKDAGKLGLLLYQYPPWCRFGPEGFRFIHFSKETCGGLPMAVEFRHGSWLTDANRPRVLDFLKDNEMTLVAADEPQYGSLATVPFIPVATTNVGYVRLHGRNNENWFKKGIDVSLRYAYKYSDEELKSLAEDIMALGLATTETHVMFNNCYGAFAVKNAARMKELLKTP
jgi:uncharacterized protein YecE (DUF72 family)